MTCWSCVWDITSWVRCSRARFPSYLHALSLQYNCVLIFARHFISVSVLQVLSKEHIIAHHCAILLLRCHCVITSPVLYSISACTPFNCMAFGPLCSLPLFYSIVTVLTYCCISIALCYWYTALYVTNISQSGNSCDMPPIFGYTITCTVWISAIVHDILDRTWVYGFWFGKVFCIQIQHTACIFRCWSNKGDVVAYFNIWWNIWELTSLEA